MTAAPTRPGAPGNPSGRHGRSRFTLYDTMPWQFMLALQQLREQQVGRGRVDFHGDRLNTALLWAIEAGWTPSALGMALGISRQAVSRRLVVARNNPSASSVPIPEPERKA
jgi:hypothetical protein